MFIKLFRRGLLELFINLISTSMGKDYFGDYKVEKPEFTKLPEGDSTVRIIRAEALTSFQKYDGSAKDELPEWKDSGPQLAITVVASEEGKNGGLTHRFNALGYKRYDELSAKELESGKYENIGGYTCMANKNGDMVRVIDKDRTQSCKNILNQFAAAAQIPVGESLMDGIAKAIASKTNIRVTVTNKQFDGVDQLRLTRFRAEAVATIDDGFEDEKK